MIKSEIHIFIIWSKARYKEKKILKDMDEIFEVLNVFEIEWDKKNYSNNLTRFYGQKLPKNSHKEEHCGNGKFLLVIVKDKIPKYEERMTSRKKLERVNINMFDSKKKYRDWTGGGHKIHGTDSELETRHNIALLLGKTLDEYLNNKGFSKEKKFLKRDLIGNKGWSSLKELFTIMNETMNYVVLRNFESYPDEFDFSIHGDVDILVENYIEATYILNCKKKYNKSFRVANEVLINGEMIDFDLRYIGDDYYPKQLEIKLLKTKQLYKGFFIPEEKKYFYSLIYHALIHKTYVIDDYKEKLLKEYNKQITPKIEKYNLEIMRELLLSYLNKNNLVITEPKDYSVYLNNDHFLFEQMTIKRKFLKTKIKFKGKIKEIINYKGRYR